MTAYFIFSVVCGLGAGLAFRGKHGKSRLQSVLFGLLYMITWPGLIGEYLADYLMESNANTPEGSEKTG